MTDFSVHKFHNLFSGSYSWGLSLFVTFALALAFQHLTRKHCLHISGPRMQPVLCETDFLFKKLLIYSLFIPLVESSYLLLSFIYYSYLQKSPVLTNS